MKKNPTEPLTLESVQRAFAEWRRTRTNKRTRIPGWLLEQAAEVCKRERPTRVARQLGLSYNVLKKQREAGSIGQNDFRAEKQEFIEVDLEPVQSSTLKVEIERTGKETVRFFFSGMDQPQIHQIVRLFL